MVRLTIKKTQPSYIYMTLEMAWWTRPPQLVLSGGPVTPTPIREYNGLRGENRGPFKGQQASASNPVMYIYTYGSGHETVAVLLPGFAINW